MSDSSVSSSGQRHSWRASAESDVPRHSLRRLKRLIVTLLLGGLLVVFGLLLLRPFWHSNAQLLVFASPERLAHSEARLLASPPMAYVVEDFSALDSLASVLMQSGSQPGPINLPELSTPDAFSQIGESIDNAVHDGCDVLIVYVKAQGVSENGVAQFCWNFDPQIEPRAELDRTEYSNRILPKADDRVTDCPHNPALDVRHASDPVDDLFSLEVVEQRVDREVAPVRVLVRIAEHVVTSYEQVIGP